MIKKILPSSCFAIIVDETMDISRYEQVAICLRYINDKLLIQAVFIRH